MWKPSLVSCLRVSPRERVVENDSSLLSKHHQLRSVRGYIEIEWQLAVSLYLLKMSISSLSIIKSVSLGFSCGILRLPLSLACGCEEANPIFEEEV